MTVIALKPVESSNVAAIGYDHEAGLFVRFKSGKLYRYPGFPAEKFSEFAGAQSIGSYFAHEVRKFFEAEQIEDEFSSYGRIAFEAYAAMREGRAVNGDPIPAWSVLDAPSRDAWEAAANAVLEQCREL